jgi:[ribosomal protein S5]-alanine N-acetyltransferase
VQIETARLVLREFREDDFAAVREYDSDPVTRYYEPPIPTEDDTREYLRKAYLWAQEEPRTHYRFAITIRSSDTPARARGRLALTRLDADHREWEIGWTVHRVDWGHGYATEAATAVLRLAFEKHNAHRVIAFCNAGNAASVRVMQKLGMTQEGHFGATRPWGGGWADEFLFAILDREWPFQPRSGAG